MSIEGLDNPTGQPRNIANPTVEIMHDALLFRRLMRLAIQGGMLDEIDPRAQVLRAIEYEERRMGITG